MVNPLVTVVVPSFNQGNYLNDALTSIFLQDLSVEVFVMDGGSTDNTLEVIEQWAHKLAGWRSSPDQGQSAAINEGIAKGTAPYVCWLNSDDWFLAGVLKKLCTQLAQQKKMPAIYGRAWNVVQKYGMQYPVRVEPFNEHRLAIRCIVSQPATLIRRSAWEQVGGLNSSLHMAMDYDLWWRLFKCSGALGFLDDFVAVNRVHDQSKTNTFRRKHYSEAITVVREHYGRVPLKWWLAQPYSVWFKSVLASKLLN